jgi:hypothetical protein
VFEVGKNFNAFFKRRNLTEVLQKMKRKDAIETQPTTIETLGLFGPRKNYKGKLSCNL